VYRAKGKKVAAYRAAEFIQDGMIVGLGTGSTAAFFIEALSLRYKTGLMLEGVVPSSKRSAELARLSSLPVRNLNDVDRIDITVDGADEIDSLKRMIKGGGGAHMREKILAFCSKEMVVIVDESKIVSTVGMTKLPIEILPFGATKTGTNLETLGYEGHWRAEDEVRFITENGNYIYDIPFKTPPLEPERLDQQILRIPGVLETGFFFNLAGRVVIGYENGSVSIWH
jgi:ribose 5-phosphate isomerase A